MPQVPYSVNCVWRWGAGSEHSNLSAILHLRPGSFLKTLTLAQNSSTTSRHSIALCFSSLFTYSATTLEGLSWAPICSTRVTPVPALVASQLIRRHFYIQPLFIESLYVSGTVLEDVGDSAGKRTIKYLPSRS